MTGSEPGAGIPEPAPRGQAGNLGLLFAAHAGSSRTAITDLRDPDAPRTVSYRDLDALCDAVARGLVRAGLRAGDRVAVLSLNRVEFIAVVLGAMRAGVVPVPINVKLAADTVHFIVDDAGARLLFTESALRDLCPDGRPTIEFDGETWQDFLAPGPFAAVEPGPDTVAIQPYTSGSTGRPKGVLLSHFGQNWSRLVLAWSRETTADDVILVAAPLYHKNALNAVKQGLTAGGGVVLLPRFDVERYIEAIGRYRCTVISGVPTMTAMVLARTDLLSRTDLGSVRLVMMGSAPPSPRVLEDLQRLLPGAEALIVYGITEGGPVPLGPHPEGKPRPPGSIGAPYRGTEATLTGGDTPDQGELLVRNPGVMLGYHHLPQETERRLRNGWFHTGDVCRRDADGFYWFVGRTDDMFVCGGENVFPAEVVRLLEQHPAVHQAVVLPFAHEIKGQVPYAFVVLRADRSASEDELKRHVLERGPAYLHPRRVFFLERMPLAGTQKIDQAWLRQQVAAGTLEPSTHAMGAHHV